MNILLIATRDPRGPATGRKMVLRTIIRSLGDLGHDVTVVAFGKREEPPCKDQKLGAEIRLMKVPGLLRVGWNAARANLFGQMSLNECLYYCPRISRRIQRIVAETKADLVVADMIRTAEYAAETGLPWFVDLDDLLSTRYETWVTQAQDASAVLGYYGNTIGRVPRYLVSRLAARLLRWEATILRRREIEIAQRADGVSLVSEPEARHLSQLSGKPVCCLPMALDVTQSLPPELHKRPMEMAFTGGLDYKPNLESIIYYARHIVPVLREHGLGHLRLNVFGQCSDSVRAAWQSPHILLHGYVDDLHRSLAGCQLFLAPLQSGTGVKTKIVEAMLLGLPVVTTPIGTQGLDVQHRAHCYIWHSADELTHILRNIEAHPQEAAEVAYAGMQYARSRFSPTVLKRSWAGALSMVQHRPTPAASLNCA